MRKFKTEIISQDGGGKCSLNWGIMGSNTFEDEWHITVYDVAVHCFSRGTQIDTKTGNIL